MTIYRSLLRLVLLLPMAGALLICVPPAQALVTHPVPAGTVSLTVVASSRKGLGGRYVWYTALSFPSSLIFGPQGRLYFINADRTILTLSRRGIISVVARGGLQGYAHGPGNRQVPEYNLLNGLAITKKGTLYTLFNGAFSRVTPHGHIVFVPLHTPGNRALLNPNAPSTPYEVSFHYPSFQYVSTGPRGHVYVSTGGLPSMNGKPATGETYRVGPDNRGIPVRWCEAPAQVHTQAVSGPHDTVYAAVGSYIEAAVPGCPLITAQWTILFYNPKLNFRGLPAISPHGHFLYVTSRRTIYRMPLPSVPKVNDKRK